MNSKMYVQDVSNIRKNVQAYKWEGHKIFQPKFLFTLSQKNGLQLRIKQQRYLGLRYKRNWLDQPIN